jgi:deoxyribonuclease V
LQAELAGLVLVEERLPQLVSTVLGVDAAYDDAGHRAFAAGALMEIASGTVLQIVSAQVPARFPYVPGLLSFREVPALVVALEQLTQAPDLVMCDGQGIAHPRRFGMACHIGVLYDLPTIGCAKTRLTGEAAAPAASRGSRSPLVDAGQTVGAVLRTQDGVKPVYVSPGHRVSLEAACHWTLALSRRYRIPDPIRIADQVVGKMKRESS